MVIGVGVPMLLTYVYCVVPFHLCRQGLCGKGSCAGADKNDDEQAAQPRSIQDIWNMHTFNAITSWCFMGCFKVYDMQEAWKTRRACVYYLHRRRRRLNRPATLPPNDMSNLPSMLAKELAVVAETVRVLIEQRPRLVATRFSRYSRQQLRTLCTYRLT
jgi:hypothetical protein